MGIPWDDLDPGITAVVRALAGYEIGTFSSCQGGPGHSCLMPEVLFLGQEDAGMWAVWLLESQGFRVQELSRHWDLDFGSPRQPFWRVVMSVTEPAPPPAPVARRAGKTRAQPPTQGKAI